MLKNEINQILTESINKCWHNWFHGSCSKCNAFQQQDHNIDYTKWKNFKELLEIADYHNIFISIEYYFPNKESKFKDYKMVKVGGITSYISNEQIPSTICENIIKCLKLKIKDKDK